MFFEIVKTAKGWGCPVTVYRELKKINGSNGYFCADPRPHIKVAIEGRPWPKCLELIIHEFCHFWQWKDGFLGKKDDAGNIIYSRILEGEKVTPREREKASRLVRISEYDCERRTADLFSKWNLESIFPKEEHIKSANTYNRHIVWSIGDKNNIGSGFFLATYDKLGNKLWGSKVFSQFWDPKTAEGRKKILAPISPQQKKIFDDALAAVKRRGPTKK